MRLASICFVVAALAHAEGPLEVRLGSRRETPLPDSAGPSFLRASVNWVSVPVHVMDESGAPRAGLTRADFQLFEDGREQTILRLTEEETPVSLTVVFDASSSMRPRMDDARAALQELFPHALPGDEYALIEFGNDARLLTGFTRETADIERAAAKIETTTWTALYDAIYMGLSQVRSGSNARKALLVISDGGDNNSRYSVSDVRSLAREADAEIYAIGIGGTSKQLQQLADDTGGQSVEITNAGQLPQAIARISRLLRLQYVIGYTSTGGERNGLWRRIVVKTTAGPGRAYAKHGYYQPQD